MLLGTITWCCSSQGAQYDKVFPLRFEVCSLTDAVTVPPKPRFDWGHIVLFLSGVCKDESANKPAVKTCFDQTDGVTVSVNSRTKNVNWVAVPGRKLSYFGLMDEGQRLTIDTIKKTKEVLKKLNLYKGVEIYIEKPEEVNAKDDVLAENSITMEAGITYARKMNCVSMPVNQAQVADSVAFLNSLNDYYFNSRVFKWNPWYNNCAHLVHNVLANILIWKKKDVDVPWYDSYKNVAIPSNEPLDLMNLVFNTSIDNPLEVYKDEYLRMSFEKYGVLPVRHGILSNEVKMKSENDLFNIESVNFYTFQLPESKINYGDYGREVSGNSIYFNLKDNLLHFKKIYESAVQKRRPASDFEQDLHDLPKDDFMKFYSKYYSYLEKQLEDVNFLLNKNEL